MEIKNKGELIAALQLAQIQLQTCDDLTLNESFAYRTLSCNEDLRINKETIVYVLKFGVSNNKPTTPERVKIRKLRKRL